MQFCQPAYPGYVPNYNPCSPPPISAFQNNGYPDIIGEGYVTTMMSPDGSIQYLFIPTTQWWRPSQPPCNPNYGNSNTQWNNNIAAWFIRSACPPMQQSLYPGICSQVSFIGAGAAPPCSSNSFIELHKTNYQMKFHNDGCTSTSDIHYFYPTLRACNWFQVLRTSASCQTETSTSNSSRQDRKSINVFCKNNTKDKVEDMNCSSNTSESSRVSFGKCTEIEPQKYDTRKSCRREKVKDHNCACCSKDKANTKQGHMSYSSCSSAEKMTPTHSDDYYRKKNNHKLYCTNKAKEKPVSIFSNSSADKIKSDDSSRKRKLHCKRKKLICKCNEQAIKVDKSCITCTEQGSNCNEEIVKETQTECKASTGSMTKTNITEQTKQPIKKSSLTFCGDYESCFGTPTCSCCTFSTSSTESDRRRPCYSKKNKKK